jgi:hypothetical protein
MEHKLTARQASAVLTEPKDMDELVESACGCYQQFIVSSRDVIRRKFELGRLVTIALAWAGNADSAVLELASTLSRRCGKTVLPQRLYEAARFHRAFGGDLNRVWELERVFDQPLTYTFLIRHVVPIANGRTAVNREEWALVQEARLEGLERAAMAIEVLDIEASDAATREDAGEAVSVRRENDGTEGTAGLLVACRESPAHQRFATHTLIHVLFRLARQLAGKTQALGAAERHVLDEILTLLSLLRARQLDRM